MLDYSGELLLRPAQDGRGDVLDRLRGITCDPGLRRYVEWLGTMWGHAVASSTPLPDLKLHMRAWQQQFAAIYGWDALGRVRGFSPPEMHLPNHPDAAFEYVKTLRGVRLPLAAGAGAHGRDAGGARPAATSTCRTAWCAQLQRRGRRIVAVIKTQGSDTKLVAQMQPYYEARACSAAKLAGSRSRRS